jgi:hypothetical protein
MYSTGELPLSPAKIITYVISIFSAEELSKPESKCKPRNVSFDLATDEPWDTMKAQLLAKIEAFFSPQLLNFDNYLWDDKGGAAKSDASSTFPDAVCTRLGRGADGLVVIVIE